jgi:hypothetical protein
MSATQSVLDVGDQIWHGSVLVIAMPRVGRPDQLIDLR